MAMSTPETPDAAPAPSSLPPAFEGTAVPTPTPALAAAETGPRVRWAGIVWGIVLAAIAAVALWILTDAARRVALTEWMLEVTPAAAAAYAVLVVGGFALVAGVVGLARRAQRTLERRRVSPLG